jgi:quercetin dioxygenase-like cupin family protein
MHVDGYPTGASKYNPIERRLFSQISRNWAGEPLASYEKILKFIRTTKTSTGLRVRAWLDRRDYPVGVKPSAERLRQLRIIRAKVAPRWNYTFSHQMWSSLCAPPKAANTVILHTDDWVRRVHRDPRREQCRHVSVHRDVRVRVGSRSDLLACDDRQLFRVRLISIDPMRTNADQYYHGCSFAVPGWHGLRCARQLYAGLLCSCRVFCLDGNPVIFRQSTGAQFTRRLGSKGGMSLRGIPMLSSQMWRLVTFYCSFAVTAAAGQVPMEQESLHHLVFENQSLEVLQPVIMPGETTAEHLHSYDEVNICIGGSTMRVHSPGADGSSLVPACTPGQAGVIEYAGRPASHTVQNVGQGVFRLLVVNNLRERDWSTNEPLSAAATKLVRETRAFQIFEVDLDRGSSGTSHVHSRPTIVVLVSGEATAGRKRLRKPGQWLLISEGEPHRLVSERGAHLIEIEVR